MKAIQRFFLAIFGLVVPALLLTPNCAAECGVAGHARPARTSFLTHPGAVRLLPAAFFQEEEDARALPSIVGFWHQKLIVSTPGGGTEVLDDDLAQWHSDHTEMQNTLSRPPSTTAVCLGVWEQTGRYTYKLNHFPLIWDETGTTYVGPMNIREQVTLSQDGNRYRGTFTLVQYDPSGKRVLGSAEGVATGTRITVNSKPESVFGSN
jgi:hypothetical protein